MNRDLDGVYFRVQRNGEWENICFSDLNENEMDVILDNRTNDWYKNLCKILARTLKEIGNNFKIIGGCEILD